MDNITLVKKYHLNYLIMISVSLLFISSVFLQPFILSTNSIQAIDDSWNIVSELGIDHGTPSKDLAFNPPNGILPSILYTPINNAFGNGDNFTVSDTLTVSHPFSLTLNSSNTYSNSFNITEIPDYSVESLEYNMTVKSSEDYYTVEDLDGKDQKFDGSHEMIAQGFEINWDYAGFSGAKIFLDVEGPSLGSDEIELYVVKPDISGFPNMSAISSYEIDGPYNSSHMFPISSSGNFAYFNFTYSVLERGSYFLVISKTSDDGGDDFIWWANDDLDNYDTYKYDPPEWKDESRDYNLILELKETDQYGNPKIFTSPEIVSLKDNSTDIISFTEVIPSTGNHVITSNNSVNVICNNSYVFANSHLAHSSYQVSNSSYYEYSTTWDVKWLSPLVSFIPYSNPYRINTIYTPTDWNNNTFTFSINEIPSLGVYRTSNGYAFNLYSLISGADFIESNLTLTTSSPNYIYDSILNADSFELGYWSFNGTHAIGHNGSIIIADTFVKERPDKNALSGDLNFTVFDLDGEIVKQKTDIYSNITFEDATNYSNTNSTQTSPGHYTLNTCFDPSINRSDKAGYWTVGLLWKNGTEVGFFAKKISVMEPTFAQFEWEVSHNSDIWTNDTLATVTRINGDSLRVRVYYYNISEPFFNNLGHLISNANVFSTTEWEQTDILYFQDNCYNNSINAISPAGFYFIQLNASADFLISQTIQFNLRLLHQFNISTNQIEYSINYTNEAKIRFSLFDTSNFSSFVTPETIDLRINDTPVQLAAYSYIVSNPLIELTIETAIIDLQIGYYELNVTVLKENFVEFIDKEYIDFIFYIAIEPVETDIQIITTYNEVTYNSIITLEFRFIDTNHSIYVFDATFEVSFDNDDVELVSKGEIDGLYYLRLQIFEPQDEYVNVTIQISKNGYISKSNFLIASMKLTSSQILPLPFYFYIIFSVLAVIIISVLVFLRFRKKKQQKINTNILRFEEAYSIYSSILSINKVLFVHENTGLPVFDFDLGSGIDQDPALISGFFQAISQMGSELRGRDTAIRSINYRNFVLTRFQEEKYILYVFSESALDKVIEQKLVQLILWFSKKFEDIAEKWSGSVKEYNSNKHEIFDKIRELLDLWVLYPFEVSPDLKDRKLKLDKDSKKILKYIAKSEWSTLSRVLDEMSEYIPTEKGLVSMFNLMKENYLIPIYEAYELISDQVFEND